MNCFDSKQRFLDVPILVRWSVKLLNKRKTLFFKPVVNYRVVGVNNYMN